MKKTKKKITIKKQIQTILSLVIVIGTLVIVGIATALAGMTAGDIHRSKNFSALVSLKEQMTIKIQNEKRQADNFISIINSEKEDYSKIPMEKIIQILNPWLMNSPTLYGLTFVGDGAFFTSQNAKDYPQNNIGDYAFIFNKGENKEIQTHPIPTRYYANADWYLATKRNNQPNIVFNTLFDQLSQEQIQIQQLIYPIWFNNRYYGSLNLLLNLNQLGEFDMSAHHLESPEFFAITPDKTLFSTPDKSFIGKNCADFLGEELTQAILDKTDKGENYNTLKKINGRDAFFYATTIEFGPFGKGFIGISFSFWQIFLPMVRQITLLLFNSVIVLIVFIIISSILINKISKIFNKIADTMMQLSKGDFQTEIESLEKYSKTKEACEVNDAVTYFIQGMQIKQEEIINLSQKDFTQDIVLSSDEDQLGKALMTLTKELRTFFLKIKESVKQNQIGSNQIANAAQSLSLETNNQANAIEKISAELTDLNDVSKKNEEVSVEANKVTNSSAQIAEMGNEQVTLLLDTMKEIADAAVQTETVVKTIDDIAFQTNLLALNANVEAARAGKAGRGFAVVAEEVRNLALKSANSVLETQSIIEQINEKVKKGVDYATLSSAELHNIVAKSKEASVQTANIQQSSIQQNLSIEEITKAISQIELTIQANSSTSEESAAAAEELAAQAKEMQDIISTIILPEDKEA